MAYTQLPDGTIVINGFEKGIADDPYTGIADMRNVNLISIPKEASVGFKTQLVSPSNLSGSVVSANSTDKTVTLTGLSGSFGQGQAVVFSGGSLPSGLTAGTTYWLTNQSGSTYFVYTDFALTTLAAITATGTGTIASIDVGYIKYFTKLSNPYTQSYWGVDNNGRVWTDMLSGVWKYTGNSITTRGSDQYKGCGIVAYSPSDCLTSTYSYVFVFSAGAIDYAKVTSNSSLTWTYGWEPSTGTTAQSNYLNTGQADSTAIHETFVAPDNVVYYCDARYIGRFYEAPGQSFDPTNTAKYIFDQTQLLPSNDSSTCLAFLGTNLLIGGQRNVLYPWNTTDPTFTYPILIAESYVSKMVTVNTNTFILAGNRGRMYVTNGSQATLYKKLPDHISGTVEPYFTWGGLTTTKNQIYFSASCTNNAGTAISDYGGVWAIDVDTKALRLTNKLSYNTYAGYASALIAIINTTTSNPGGAGLIIGWNSGASTYGIDQTVSSTYSAGEAIVDSDLIPIGTVLKPTTSGTVEFKLTTPLASGDTIKIQYRQKFSDSFADITTSAGTTTFNTAGIYSGVYQNVNFQSSQWVQFRAVLTSNGSISTTNYVRLTEIRVK